MNKEDVEHKNMQVSREEKKSHTAKYILKYPTGGRYCIISYEITA
jgi:hypothetical protein